MFKTRTIGASALAISLALGGTAYTSSKLKAADINEYVGVDLVSEIIVGTYEDDTTLDATRRHRASTRDAEHVLHGHQKRLVDVPLRLRYIAVDRVH